MADTPSIFNTAVATPFYPGYPLFNVGGGAPRQWEFNGWKRESMSWKTGCYIHGGLSGPGQFLFHGSDAEMFLQGLSVNSFEKFAVGTARHVIMCDDRGLIASHGVMQRLKDAKYRFFVAGAWSLYKLVETKLDVKVTIENRFMFQVAGPNSLALLEKITGENLKDIKYLGFRDTSIAGQTVQIMRVGMSGTLAFELHGPIEQGPELYDLIFKVGQAYAIERLGWQTYPVNHIEAGFAQQIWTFLNSVYNDKGFLEYADRVKPVRFTSPLLSGSVDPTDWRARFRTPLECRWGKSVKFDHDFVGRAALEKEHADPRRTVVTLEWDSDDVVDVYASLFSKGEEYKYIELPTMPNFRAVLGHGDHVLKNGKQIGVSSGIAYSYFYRKMISHCVIDMDQAEIGNEVTIQWGDFGKRMKEIRARVERFPYLIEGENPLKSAAKS